VAFLINVPAGALMTATAIPADRSYGARSAPPVPPLRSGSASGPYHAAQQVGTARRAVRLSGWRHHRPAGARVVKLSASEDTVVVRFRLRCVNKPANHFHKDGR
jgi:hypothetical protein